MAQTQTVTILFCDLVGSTALMTRLGDDANDRVRRRLFAALREAVTAHRGEEVKSAGDGLMVAFPASAAVAVSCAVAMQRGVARLNERDPLLGLAVRIGLSSGEASHEADDWFGVPVVEAARLEHAARPGQILAADLTRGLVGTRGGHIFTSVGTLELKGLPEPLAAAEVAWEPDPGLSVVPLPSGLARHGFAFAGRARELVALRADWDETVDGDRRFVLVTGEDGIGKTRLAAELAAQVHANDVVVLYGHCQADREVPYQPFAEALRWYVLASQPQPLREQAGASGRDLTRLVPALRTRLPDLPEPRTGDPAAEQEWLFEAVSQLLGAAAERCPILLVVDDLEQASANTLGMLRHLLESPKPARLMVLGLAGPAEPGSPWQAEAAALAGLPGATSVELHGLTVAEVATLLEGVEGVPHSDELAGRIQRETEGNPRYVADLVVRLRDSESSPEAVLQSACPYMGLRSFEADDAELYFGREEVVGALLGRLASNRLLAVVGASGSGKSSLMRAGLVPRLRSGALPGSGDWDVLLMTPGTHPLAELASRLGALAGLSAASVLRDLEADPRTLDLTVRQALANRPPSARVLLAADQFEELFTLCRDDVERRRFIDAVLHAVSVPDGRTLAIVAMRADFYGEAARYAELAEALEVGHALLGPMGPEEMRAAVERPAAVAGLRIEPGLTDRILRDVGDEPGGLPLLSHALLETWKRRDGRTLTAAGYAASGGVRGAIAQTAETVYGALSEADQAIARNLFVRLTELGEGTEDTRRRVAFAEVAPQGPTGENTRAVISRLADSRLLTTAADSVEVAHEALIREWPRLREWLDDDREGLRVMRHLTESAQAWERLGRDEGELYRGTRLSAAIEWHDRAHPELNPLEREFLDACRALHERELLEARKRLRRLRIGVAALAGLFVLALVGAGIAVLQWNSANDAKDKANAATNEAQSQRDAADGARANEAAARGKAEDAVVEATLARLETDIPNLIKSNRSLAFALAAQAFKIQPGPRTTSLLNVALGDDPRYLGRYWPSEPISSGTAFSPDGKYIAMTSTTGLIELYDAATRKVVASTRTAPTSTGTGVQFTADSKALSVVHIATFTGDQIYDEVYEVPSLAKTRQINLAGAGAAGAVVRTPQGDVRAWELRTTPLLTCCGAIHIVNLTTGEDRALTRPDFDFVFPAPALDPTGKLIAARFLPAKGGPPAIGIFDASTFDLLRIITLPPAQIFALAAIQFTPDSKSLLFARPPNPSVLELWDPRSGGLIASVPVGAGYNYQWPGVNSQSSVAAAGTAAGMTLFSLPQLPQIGIPFPTPDTIYAFFGPGDRTLVTWPFNQPADSWDVTGLAPAATYSFDAGTGRAVLSPDGGWFAKQARDGTWSRWDAKTLKLLNRSQGQYGNASTNQGAFPVELAISPDSRYIASAHADCAAIPQLSCSGRVVLWDAATGQPVGKPIPIPNPTNTGLAIRLAFHPDRALLAVSLPGLLVQTWAFDGGSLSLRSEFKVPGDNAAPILHGMTFVRPRDGSEALLLTIPLSQWNFALFDVSTDPPALRAKSPFGTGAVNGVHVAPGGRLVVDGQGDFRFYDVLAFAAGTVPKAELTLAGAGLPLIPADTASFSFSADGRRMAVLAGSGLENPPGVGKVTVWDLDKKQPIGASFGWAGPAGGAFLTPDSSALIVTSNQAAVRWDLDTSKWFDDACMAAGRNLTEAEWTKYFPGREYEVTCPQWPAKPKT